MNATPYPNISQISHQAQNGTPAAKLLMVALALIVSLDPAIHNGREALEKLKQMAERFGDDDGTATKS